VLGLLCVAAAIKYTVGRSAYGYRGLGDVFVFVFFGLVSVVGSQFLYTQQIDKAVYQLYGLTEEDVRIVEGGKDVSDIKHIIISDQFPHNMALWLGEKTENVINYVYRMQQILLSGYSDESGIDKFLSHRFPFDSCPDMEYMKDLFSSCNFPSDREEISELFSKHENEYNIPHNALYLMTNTNSF